MSLYASWGCCWCCLPLAEIGICWFRARRAHFPYTLCGIACSGSRRSSVCLPESPLIFSFGAFNGVARREWSGSPFRPLRCEKLSAWKQRPLAFLCSFVLSGTDKGTDDGRWITAATRSRIKIGMRSDRPAVNLERRRAGAGGNGNRHLLAADRTKNEAGRWRDPFRLEMILHPLHLFKMHT